MMINYDILYECVLDIEDASSDKTAEEGEIFYHKFDLALRGEDQAAKESKIIIWWMVTS